jgi:hypothetical protein
MIGVAGAETDLSTAAELFELFKTPWAPFDAGRSFDVVIASDAPPETDARLVIVLGVGGPQASDATVTSGAARLRIYGRLSTISAGEPLARNAHGEVVVARDKTGSTTTLRCGFDLLAEVRHLLRDGQPPEHASIPALDLHVDLLRRWILAAGIPLLEVPPRAAGAPFLVSLTHDIDFLRLRDHRFDHTLAGFLLRSTVGSVREGIRGRRSWSDVRRNVATAATTPLVQLGLRDDPWQPFESYVEADSPARSTFFVVPFAGRPGQNVSMPKPQRRAVRYELEDARGSIGAAVGQGFEMGVHAIDAWIDVDAARVERARIAEFVGREPDGVRIHWLCRDHGTPSRLEAAGFGYDASVGYNDAVGFRAGTLQPFRPLGCSRLLELPLHLQDTSLFYPRRMSLGASEAWRLAESLVEQAEIHGGALTVSWHDRSLAPERLWGAFYANLLSTLRERGAKLQTAADTISFFRSRRSLRLDQHAGGSAEVSGDPGAAQAGLLVRVARPDGAAEETPWRGTSRFELPEHAPARGDA